MVPEKNMGFPGGSDNKESPAVQETWVWSLHWEGPLEKGMATHSSSLAGESHGQRSLACCVGHNWATNTFPSLRRIWTFIVLVWNVLMVTYFFFFLISIVTSNPGEQSHVYQPIGTVSILIFCICFSKAGVPPLVAKRNVADIILIVLYGVKSAH